MNFSLNDENWDIDLNTDPKLKHVALCMPKDGIPRTDYVASMFAKVGKTIGDMDGCPETPAMWPMVIKMACDMVYTFQGPDDFPIDTLMCECGDTKHVVVLWP